MKHSDALNADELLHLAIHSIEHDTPDKAIALLKRLLEIQPDNGNAHYLLGALHAEIGMHDQAAEEMARALELKPDLTTARFQLGLLHITSGRVAEAEAVWKALDSLGSRDPLYLFKKGMLHLVRDEFGLCAEAMKAGIELNAINENLNGDMRRVLQDAELAMSRQAPEAVGGPDAKSGDGQRMLLSRYESQDSEDF